MRWEKGLPKGLPPGASLPFCLEVVRGSWAHVHMSPPPGPRKEEDTFASHQPTADPCPSNTCSSFLQAQAAVWPEGSRGKGARLVAAAKGSVLHSQHRPRAIWCPSPCRKGVGCRQQRKRTEAIA